MHPLCCLGVHCKVLLFGKTSGLGFVGVVRYGVLTRSWTSDAVSKVCCTQDADAALQHTTAAICQCPAADCAP